MDMLRFYGTVRGGHMSKPRSKESGKKVVALTETREGEKGRVVLAEVNEK